MISWVKIGSMINVNSNCFVVQEWLMVVEDKLIVGLEDLSLDSMEN